MIDIDTMPIDDFKKLFSFDPQYHLYVGIERELYITRDGEFLPLADDILRSIGDMQFPSTWTHEFSACALEQTIGPVKFENLHDTVVAMDISKSMIEQKFDVELLAYEVAPNNLPSTVYPDPTGRFGTIVETASSELVDAALRTGGIHIHIGIASHDQALRVHQKLSNETVLEYLLSIGDNSNRERIDLIQHFTDWSVDSFTSWSDFYEYIKSKDLLQDLKSYRPLIRISKHGTIEFRMFGSTNSRELIEFYVKTCHGLVSFALNSN